MERKSSVVLSDIGGDSLKRAPKDWPRRDTATHFNFTLDESTSATNGEKIGWKEGILSLLPDI